MCGIAGRINFRSGAPVDAASIERMCAFQHHRGPDGRGAYINGAAGLGHRRLAILDLSDAGLQPMPSADRRVWITYNGEIYNFAELKQTLTSLGHAFRTATDTEVILAAYQQWGVGCLPRLRGMFGFAIWDEAERTLLLARDRLGEKPLYYRLDEDGIAFASEPKAFFAESSFRPRADLPALSHYLSFQYVPAPLSAFEGVRRLEPASYLVLKDGRVDIQRYWHLNYTVKSTLSEDAAVEELTARFQEAVRMRLVSDVPLGAFLSGGVDSSAVVAMMAEAGPVKTFSIGFGDPKYDERRYARLIAEKYATDHHEFVVERPAADILSKIVWHYGEPFADSSAIPTYYLSELTRAHVTVALNGDAGDENFAGYDRYRAVALAARYDRAPDAVKSMARALGRALPASAAGRSMLSRGKRFMEGFSDSPDDRYARWMMHFHPDQKATLCTPDFLQRARAADSLALMRDAAGRSDAVDVVERAMALDVHTYLPDDLLVKVDIATMAHGLEGRAPLLDHPLVEFAASLPLSLKLRGSTGKYIFKKAMATRLHPEIVNRPKMGFGVPLEAWFRGELKEIAYDTLLSRSLEERGYFRRAEVSRLLDEHASGAARWHYQLWNLLMLELWHRTFIDAVPAAPVWYDPTA